MTAADWCIVALILTIPTARVLQSVVNGMADAWKIKQLKRQRTVKENHK